MTASYSNEELTAIANAAMMTGMVVAMADMGIISSAIEAAAMTKEIMGAAAKYPNNSIVQAAFSEAAIRGGTVKMAKPDVKAEDITSGAYVDKAIVAVNNVVVSLAEKATPEEIKEYKTLIYSIGEAVANAAGSGLFGSGATKVSPEEAAALTKIKAALGI
jgi:flagellar motor protein MotB